MIAELTYYELGRDSEQYGVPILVVDEYDSFMGAEKFFGADVITKLHELIREKNAHVGHI